MSKSILTYLFSFEEGSGKPFMEIKYSDRTSKRGVLGTPEFLEVGREIVEHRGDSLAAKWVEDAEKMQKGAGA